VAVGDPRCHGPAEAVRAVGTAGAAAAYPPPYGPALNPIGNALPKPRGLPRPAGGRAAGRLWSFPGRPPDAFTPGECRNYSRHRGYTATARCKPD
jgi:hypothetical protein